MTTDIPIMKNISNDHRLPTMKKKSNDHRNTPNCNKVVIEKSKKQKAKS